MYWSQAVLGVCCLIMLLGVRELVIMMDWLLGVGGLIILLGWLLGVGVLVTMLGV